ncbi:MAG: Ig domain-containing protein, partial [Chthoniobacterales bacterium]|nr:Ig domain-containing protein [Chthoniobacterales bacterium]
MSLGKFSKFLSFAVLPLLTAAALAFLWLKSPFFPKPSALQTLSSHSQAEATFREKSTSSPLLGRFGGNIPPTLPPKKNPPNNPNHWPGTNIPRTNPPPNYLPPPPEVAWSPDGKPLTREARRIQQKFRTAQLHGRWLPLRDQLLFDQHGNPIIRGQTQLFIVTPELPDGSVQKPYKAPLTAVGGIPPYSWQIIEGSLPEGLSLHPTTGLISGIPNQTYSSEIKIRVTDSVGEQDTAGFLLLIEPQDPLQIQTSEIPHLISAIPLQIQLLATGGLPPYLWTITSSNLLQFHLNPHSGILTLFPPQTTFPIQTILKIAVSDLQVTKEKDFLVRILPNIPTHTSPPIPPISQKPTPSPTPT